MGKESGLESRGSTAVLVTPKDQLSGLACLQPRKLGNVYANAKQTNKPNKPHRFHLMGTRDSLFRSHFVLIAQEHGCRLPQIPCYMEVVS